MAKIREASPDVVILDLTMPQLDGIGVMERLQTMELSRRPRIIILTAFAKDDMVRLLTNMGADYFVVKPRIGSASRSDWAGLPQTAI